MQGVLLEKATESANEAIETPGHQRRSTRGSEDAIADERQQGNSVSPDDLIVRNLLTYRFLGLHHNGFTYIVHFLSFSQALAHQYSTELLQVELERTRLNSACFIESNVSFEPVAKPASAQYASFSFRGSMDSPSRNHRSSPQQHAAGSPSFSHRNRR